MLVNKWYMYISILLTVYNLLIIYPRPDWQIPSRIVVIIFILTIIYAGYKIWVGEKSEKEKLLIKQEELTIEEKEILSGALQSSHIIYLPSSDQIGSWVQSGGIDFLYKNDLNKTRTYVYALKTLCEKGLVEKNSQVKYELTPQGFKEAEKCR
ncbi:MAG: hypothetical protein KKD89_03860 [Candidatus Omnitrophica bacterium]|nr:hypothetical protein [Candidatus Omnitrophota bacterium]